MRSEFRIESEDLSEEEKARVCAALRGTAEGDMPFVFEVVFLSPEEIRALNARERGVDAVTDVLSCPASEGLKGKPILLSEHQDCRDGEGGLYLGDIALCPERAKEQAAEYGHSYERELNYLTVHGILHCLGYDHETEEERAEMRAEEERVMARMNLTRD